MSNTGIEKGKKDDGIVGSVVSVTMDKMKHVISSFLIVGVLCTLASVVFYIYGLINEESILEVQMSYSWLFGFFVCFSIGLGGLFWTILHHATNASWGISVRRFKETLGAQFVILAIFSLPLFLIPQVRNTLWSWIPLNEQAMKKSDNFVSLLDREVDLFSKSVNKSDAVKKISVIKELDITKLRNGWSQKDKEILISIQNKIRTKEYKGYTNEKISKKIINRKFIKDKAYSYFGGILYKKKDYLNKNFFYFRYVAFFALLIGMSLFLLNKSLSNDNKYEEKNMRVVRRISYLFLVFFAICLTFSSIDWLMGLNYLWFSTMWGVYIFSGSAMVSMAVLIITVSWFKNNNLLNEQISNDHFHIMGKLLHAFVIFWAYITFSQYFLIWYSNITEETSWFLVRNTSGWRYVSLILLIFKFIIPFVALLPAWSKMKRNVLTFWSFWLIIMHFVEMYWIIIPERAPKLINSVYISWSWIYDLLVAVGLFCLFIHFFLKNLLKNNLYPINEKRLDESVHLVS